MGFWGRKTLKKILSIIFSCMLLLTSFAGCIGWGDENEVSMVMPPTEQNSKSNSETISENNMQNVSNENDSDSYTIQNMSEDDQEFLETKLNNFSEGLERFSGGPEFDDFTIKLAENISKLPKCNVETPDSLKEYDSKISNITKCLHEYKNLAEGLNKDFDLELPYADDKKISKFVSAAEPDDLKNLLTTLILIEQYNSLIDSAENVEYKNKESYADFYYALLTFGFSIILIQENMAYRVSYKLVGIIFIKTGFYKFFSNFGVLKYVMSKTYGIFKNLIEGSPSKVGEIKTDLENVNIPVNMDAVKNNSNFKNAENIFENVTDMAKNTNVSAAAEAIVGWRS